MPLKAVLFDLWETLIHDTPDRNLPRRAWRSEAVQEALSRYDFPVDFEAVQDALDATTFQLTHLHDTGHDLDSVGRAYLFIQKLEEAIGRRAPEAAVPELEEIITCMPLDKAPKPAPFALEAMTEVRRLGMATALVCNAGFTTAPHLHIMLEHYGFLPLLDVLVFSDELQIAKPDPRIFQTALDGLGVDAADCAFVGDNPHTDISGALALGIYAVQVGAKESESVTPSARIDGLHELVAALASHPAHNA